MPQPSIISDESSPDFFVPKPGQTEWWKGDAEQFPLLKSDEEHASLVQRRNVLSHAQCDVLIDCFERQKTLKAARTGSSFWDGRYIWQNNIPLTEIDALRIMQQARFVAQVTASQEFQPPKPLYSDTAQIVLWTEGIELTPHADRHTRPCGAGEGQESREGLRTAKRARHTRTLPRSMQLAPCWPRWHRHRASFEAGSRDLSSHRYRNLSYG
jgi:hypothetical protein